ncbi:MAG: DUF4177 domain-containing protein [Candidatus Micrarchaeota archaeon]
MAEYEFKVIYLPPNGVMLMPWASQELKDSIGRGCLERALNKHAKEGWEVISVDTVTRGNFLWLRTSALVIMRRQKK